MIGKEMDAAGAARASTAALPSRSASRCSRREGLGRTGGSPRSTWRSRRARSSGLAGLLGSGRTELARLLFGADQPDSGTVTIGGRAVSHARPERRHRRRGIAFCSENRKTEGLVRDLTVRENIILALQAARGWTRPHPAPAQGRTRRQVHQGAGHPPRPTRRPGWRKLSGGNQQKVLLARWLITQPKLLILDEPTRGIDVGAKAEIQKLVVSLSEDGMAVLFISAELEEVLRLSHNIGVLRDRQLVAQIANGHELTPTGSCRPSRAERATSEPPLRAGAR